MNGKLFCVFILLMMSFEGGCKRSVARLDERDLGDPLFQKARAMANAGDVEAAARLYAEMLEDAPGTARAHLELGLLMHSYRKDYASAIYHYRRYLELRPDSDKREMIEGRIRLASQSFAASVLPHERGTADAVSEAEKSEEAQAEVVAALQKENETLRNKVEALGLEIERLRQTAQTTPSAPDAADDGAPRSYRVKSGDTLSRIAIQFYNNADMSQKIYEANRDIIKDPNRLMVGQILRIP